MNDKTSDYKVVFQLSSGDIPVHKGFIKQLGNLVAAMDNVAIEVVVHGPGVAFLRNDSKFKSWIERFAAGGVKFLVCRNTLMERKISEIELVTQAEIIQTAVVHLIKRQAEHWSYIKVGF